MGGEGWPFSVFFSLFLGANRRFSGLGGDLIVVKYQNLDRSCAVVYAVAYKLQIRPWFEFVASGANWSDGASRDLLSDSFARENNFALSLTTFPKRWWTCSLQQMWELISADGCSGNALGGFSKFPRRVWL